MFSDDFVLRASVDYERLKMCSGRQAVLKTDLMTVERVMLFRFFRKLDSTAVKAGPTSPWEEWTIIRCRQTTKVDCTVMSEVRVSKQHHFLPRYSCNQTSYLLPLPADLEGKARSALQDWSA